MLQLIEKSLNKENIALWRIKRTKTKRAELYFIKKELDLPRYADMVEYEVAVYRDFEESGKKFRGHTVFYVEEGQTDQEIAEKIRNAYYAAQFVKNPFYELPEAIKEEKKGSVSNFAGKNLQDVANSFADAVLSIPADEVAFVNSLEIFVYHQEIEIIGSDSLNVSYIKDYVDGEFVTQCIKPIDVEQYRQFSFDNYDVEALKTKVSDAIEDARLRANAHNAPKTGTYNVLIKGENLKDFLIYYLYRGNASLIFPHYSDWKKGDTVQKYGYGEKLNIDLVATTPYSDDGIAMKDVTFIKDGILKNIFGPTRFMRYINEIPIGNYEKLRLNNGTMSFEEMKRKADLDTVSFSDFQMDPFTGNFGGEMRLSLLNDDGKNVPLAGGSINGKVMDIEDKMIFSTEKYEDSGYVGPYAVLIPDVPVAGE